MSNTVVIIGAGPAGLTAAYNLLQNAFQETNVYVIEATNDVGGMNKTIACAGFRYDLGGHRYLSNNPRIINIWKKLLGEDLLTVNRSSKIFYNEKLVDYPIAFSFSIISAVGVKEFAHILLDYVKIKVHPIAEQSLEDFYINRFGKRLYKLFFESYTKKVWGRSADKIPCDWGYQRIGTVSIHQLMANLLGRKNNEYSTTDSFYYPKYGSGQLWNKMKQDIIAMGGTILLNDPVKSIEVNKTKVRKIICESGISYSPSIVISSMALYDLLNSMTNIPESISVKGNHLPYRSMIVVGVLLSIDSLQDHSIIFHDGKVTKDQWIYVQDPDIKTGRIQVFSNWSEKMCTEDNSICLGMEYFCDDSFISCITEKIQAIVLDDLIKLKILYSTYKMKEFHHSIIDKAYPCYWDGYNHLSDIKEFIQQISNLYIVGRNGLHEYINTDQAMESALAITDMLKQ